MLPTIKLVKSSCFLLISLILILSTAPSQASSKYVVQASAAPKVDLTLYYETLCPYCVEFIANGLTDVFNKGLISIVNFRLVPWGNVLVQKNGTIVCQHGPVECQLNTIEACVIDLWPDVSKHFNYIHCIESLLLQSGGSKDLRTCFAKSGEWDSVVNCYTGGLGARLEEKYRTETDKLQPPHQYVPWLVINNKPIDDYTNFVKYVCNAYKGPLPPACQSQTLEFESADRVNGVSYASDKNGLTYSMDIAGISEDEIFGRKMKINV